jgi:hypothetical protein
MVVKLVIWALIHPEVVLFGRHHTKPCRRMPDGPVRPNFTVIKKK